MGLSGAFLKFYNAVESSEEKKRIVSTYFLFYRRHGTVDSHLGTILDPNGNAAPVWPWCASGLSATFFFVFHYWVRRHGSYTYLRAKEQSGRLVTFVLWAFFPFWS